MRWLGVLVAVLAAPAAAQGSTITLEVRYEPGYRGTPDYVEAIAHVVAGPGEANAIAARGEEGGVIVDDAAGVQAGTGCVVSAPHQARCAVAPGTGVRADVDSGDGDDAVSFADGLAGTVELGSGADRGTSSGRPGALLRGGPGDDVLTGGPGDDTLVGGAGADVMTGGDGTDIVRYDERTAPVTAFIGGAGGEAGEGDAIGADVENILGGVGPDVLRGGARADILSGGPGDDDIDGGGGDDRLYGHDGANRIAGGEGDDQIATDGPGRLFGGPGLDTIRAGAGDDLVDPGPGRDQVQSLGGADRLLLRDGEHDDTSCGDSGSAVADGTDLVLRCTRITRSGAARVTLSTYPAWFSGHSLGVHLLCSRDLRKGCSGRVTVRVGGRLAGRGRFVLRADADREAPVALRRFARLRVLAAGRMRVALRVDTRDARGHPIVLHAHATAYRA